MLGIAQVASAGPYEDGVAAYRRGDYATALRLLRPLANRGNAIAEYTLGVMYEVGEGVPQDYGEALKWYRLAADQGYAHAQYYFGRMYDNGRGVAQDYGEALKWYRLAANQGYANAQFSLGSMYADGHGVAQDYAEAMKWYRLAANQGLAMAQGGIGFMYDSGQGVAQDYVEAAKWYRLAANQGDAFAQFLLGSMYSNGQGVAQDYTEAVKWYRLAANQGYANAQFSLGLMYAKGNGVSQDVVQAHKWFNLAAIGGDKDAVKARSIAEGMMTHDQIALAQEMANVCRASNYRRCGEPENTQTVTAPPSTPTPKVGSRGSSAVGIPLQKDGGIFVVPVLINNAITLNFALDSGAADVTIPADVVLTLMRTGTLKRTDFTGEKVYVLADGSKVPSKTFRIRSMKVGNRVVENLTGGVAPLEGSLLLGQSFLRRFKSWSIDNGKNILLLE
jgi:TPR repeat protein